MLEPQATELIDSPAGLSRLGDSLKGRGVVAVDLEADGMHAFRPQICAIQLAYEVDEALCVCVVDTLAVDIRAIAWLFESTTAMKVVHDVSFDARLLVAAGITPTHFFDTAVAAQLLGHRETGLAAMVRCCFGVELSKALQHHDWRIRPLATDHLEYLSEDVRYLLALRLQLIAQMREQDIEPEVEEETRWRVESARHTPPTRPPWARIKGIANLPKAQLIALQALADLRERIAEDDDVPAHRIASNKALIAATHRVAEGRAVGKIGRLPPAGIARALANRPTELDEASLSLLRRPQIASEARTRRRTVEKSIGAWRRREATRRGIDEQAVLPGHCASDLASLLTDGSRSDTTLAPAEFDAQLRAVSGFGDFRAERYGAELYALLVRGSDPAPAEG